MAGDWIKVEKATTRKPEVLRIAEILKVHPDYAFALCVRFWMWCDDHLTSGHVKGVTVFTLETVFGHTGFVDALLEVGWLQAREGALVVPNFERHLSESAKARALSGERKRKQRVPKMSRSHRDKNGTREEKRREENTTPNGVVANPPQAGEVIMVFPCTGKGPAEWPLTDVKIAEWQGSYPGLDVSGECRKARQWCIDNSTRQKTFSGMLKFLNSWLTRAQNDWRQHGGQTSNHPGSPRANQGSQSPARVPNPEGKNSKYPSVAPNPAGGAAGHPA